MSELGLTKKTVPVLKIGENEDLDLVQDCRHSSLAQNQQISSAENILEIKDTGSEASYCLPGSEAHIERTIQRCPEPGPPASCDYLGAGPHKQLLLCLIDFWTSASPVIFFKEDFYL